MTGNTWTEIADAALTQGSPVTDVVINALRDNPKGIAERATGAPIVRIAQPEILTGSGTWTVPDGVTAFKVTVVGAGGGGASSVTNGSGRGGGGAGGYALKWYNSVTPGDSYSYSVPAASAVASPGGSCTFDTITANGGVNSGDLGGNGGSASGGDINVRGQDGEHGGHGTGQKTPSGHGGPSPFGSHGFRRTSEDTSGQNGSGYGAGGSGATPSATSSAPGSQGAPGVIIIEY